VSILFVGAGVAGGRATIVEASGEEEQGLGGVEFDCAGFEQGGELLNLIFHAEAEEGVWGFADPGIGAGFGGADGEVEGFALAVGVAVEGEGDVEALGEVGDGGGAVGVGKAGAGVGVAVAEDVELGVGAGRGLRAYNRNKKGRDQHGRRQESGWAWSKGMTPR
jgi:hypothetical protein